MRVLSCGCIKKDDGTYDMENCEDQPDNLRKEISRLQAKVAAMEKALKEIAALDYSRAAINGAAYYAINCAQKALREYREKVRG